jgi:hypothetical protein
LPLPFAAVYRDRADGAIYSRQRAKRQLEQEDTMTARLVPGMRVHHPGEPDWGVGQVQSVIGFRVTVNFEHAGKRLINAAVIELREIGDGVAGGVDRSDIDRSGIDAPRRGG